MSRILVIGVPRSGTSWVSRILSTAPGTVLIDEPDYPDTYPSGGFAVEEYGEYPVVPPNAVAPRYEMIWDIAFSGGFPDRPLTRRVGKMLIGLPNRVHQPVVWTAAQVVRRAKTPPTHCVVKTVHAQFAIEWIVDRYAPIVVVVRRNLLSVVGSWLQLGFVPYDTDTPFELSDHPTIRSEFLEPLSLDPPPADAPLIHRVAWHVGLLSMGLERSVARRSDWIVVDHEVLCQSPVECFRDLFSRAGLPWATTVEREIGRLDKPGEGVKVQRVASEQIDSWRTKLNPDQVVAVSRILGSFSSSAHRRGT